MASTLAVLHTTARGSSSKQIIMCFPAYVPPRTSHPTQSKLLIPAYRALCALGPACCHALGSSPLLLPTRHTHIFPSIPRNFCSATPGTISHHLDPYPPDSLSTSSPFCPSGICTCCSLCPECYSLIFHGAGSLRFLLNCHLREAIPSSTGCSLRSPCFFPVCH